MEAHILLKDGVAQSVFFKATVRRDGDEATYGTELSSDEQLQLSLELQSLTQMARAIVSKKPFVVDFRIEKPWLEFLIRFQSLYHSQTTTVDGVAVSICIPDYARVCVRLLILLKSCLTIIELAGSGQQELPAPNGESPPEKDSPSWDDIRYKDGRKSITAVIRMPTTATNG